jgi:hypothetical protein
MAFWSDNLIEPKRKFKFVVTFAGVTENETIPSFVVKKATKPSFSISESSHQFLGNKFYFPGKLEWKEVDITLIDAGGFDESPPENNEIGTKAVQPVKNDITSKIISILSKFGYQPPEQTGAALAGGGFSNGTLKTFSKFAATSVLPSIEILQLDSNGSIIESWTLHNAWVKDVNFGELDYTSEDPVEITLKLRYDWATFSDAVQNPAGTT